jgi:hypothetical protein
MTGKKRVKQESREEDAQYERYSHDERVRERKEEGRRRREKERDGRDDLLCAGRGLPFAPMLLPWGVGDPPFVTLIPRAIRFNSSIVRGVAN